MKVLTPAILSLILLAACSSGTPVAATEQVDEPPAPTPTIEPTVENLQPTGEPAAATPSASSMEFVILPELGEARFYIDELLRGQPNTVEGVNTEVTGGLSIASLDPLSVTVEPIEIQAGSFVTDNNFRNRAISDAILQAGRYPLIVFTPTSIDGLPEAGEPGQTYEVEVTGDLTIREVTQAVTFQVTLSPDATDSVSGSATAEINRVDFGLNIPSVPQVADVSEQVFLEFDFIAGR